MGSCKVILFVMGAYQFFASAVYADSIDWDYSPPAYSLRNFFRPSSREVVSLDLDPQNILNSSFRIAARENRVDDLKKMLTHGAEANSESDLGETALIYSARNCSVKAAEFLIKHGANVNLFDRNGHTALMLASRGSCTPVVKELLRTPGIQVGVRDRLGSSAKDYAQENELSEVEGPSQEILDLIQKAERSKEGKLRTHKNIPG